MDNQSHGFILINKPVGPTSHDIIYQLRKITGVKKIGHAGTLDPFASGLLIVAIGREATKRIDLFVKQDKEYVARLQLGATSDSHDLTGKILKSDKPHVPTEDEIKKVLEKFIGELEQIPPMFSAKKVAGKKLYKLARKGEVVERQPSLINVYGIEVLKYQWPVLELKVKCSTGTYVRVLAHDIGKLLGCGAYLTQLQRTKIGDYNIKKAVVLEQLAADNWQEFLLLDV
jgi:tRNA pseudouridine55 synthase